MAGGSSSSTGQVGTRTLRRILVAVAVVLVLVVVGFIAVAHFRTMNYLTGLPKRLGVNIQQESNGYTYSQSSKGKTLFTVHASKEVQRKDGRIGLHDVGIVLYGPTGQPTDRIHGADFEYDPKQQVMTATGEVYIDLVPPPSQKPGQSQEDADARMIHVKTIGLVFEQKAQTASSDGAVEFRTGGFTGNSVGASYEAKTGVVVLNSQVRMSGLRSDRPVVLTASRAELERQANLVDLQNAKYVSTGESGAQTAEAKHAVVHIKPDGTPERVNAEGGVRLTGGQQGAVESRRMDLLLGPNGQAKDAHFIEDVRYENDEGVKHSKGHAQDMRIAFDDAGRARHTVMTGGVVFVQRGPASERELNSATLEVALSGGGKAPSVVRGAEAYGPDGARVRMVDEDAKGRSSTDVRADKLTGRFAAEAKTSELTGLDGAGHTSVERTALDGKSVTLTKDTSTGDSLQINFKPGADGRSELTRAEQRGDVRTVREEAAKNGAPQVEHGRADDAVYDAQTNVVHMTGSVEVQDQTSALLADRVDANRGTGDAAANGAVRVTYLQEPSAGASEPSAAEPVHVLAARAVAHKASGLAEFFADPGGRARMWQGGSQVEAPVLDFYRKEKRLVAKGTPGADAGAVHAVLVDAEPGAARAGGKQANGPVRVVSRQMIYTDGARTVEFTGGVRVEDQSGTMTSQQATVWLTPAGAGTASAAFKQETAETTGFMAGKVDHVIATGSVVLTQPGRRGTGERLVYTANDGTANDGAANDGIYVLTGTKAVPPRVEDAVQGSTTGAALRFKAGDDSVQVLGSEDGKTAGRVRSETRMRQ